METIMDTNQCTICDIFGQVNQDGKPLCFDCSDFSSSVFAKQIIEAAAKQYTRDTYAGKSVVNRDDGTEVLIPWQGIKHAFSRHTSRVAATAAMKLGELIESAKKQDVKRDTRDRRNIHGIHVYRAVALIDGKQVPIKIFARDHDDGKRYYDHYETEHPAGQSGELAKGQGSHQPCTGCLILVDIKIPQQNDNRKSIIHLPALIKAARKLDGRIEFNGLQISIETGRSRCRQWHNPHDGSQGMSRMTLPYGYIKGTEGVDGDHYDVFVGPDHSAPNAYIVTTMKAPDFTEIDEEKAFLGVNSAEEAERYFKSSYSDERFFGGITAMPFAEFKEKVLATKQAPELLGEHQIAEARFITTRELLDAAKRYSSDLNKSGEAMCKQIGDKLGVNWKEIDLDEFCDGMFHEEEHTSVTGNDPKKTAQIVLDHLKENGKYYSKLKAAGL